jgi:hypothetical protein
MADIFISYASADQVTAHRLADRLGESATRFGGIERFHQVASLTK